MDLKTAHRLLGPAGAHPATPAGIDKRLEAIAAGRGGHAAVTVPDAVPACQTRDVEYSTAQDVAELLDAGWYGVAGDGAERLYSPSCDQ